MFSERVWTISHPHRQPLSGPAPLYAHWCILVSQVFIFAILIVHTYIFKFRQVCTKLSAVVISGAGACREVANVTEDSDYVMYFVVFKFAITQCVCGI